MTGIRASGRPRWHPFPSLVALALVGAATVLVPHGAASQAPVTLTGPTLLGEWAMEQQTRERWMHGRDRPRFTPFRATRRWVMVDSIRDSATTRRLHLTLERTVRGRDSALIVVGPTGHVARLETGLAPLPHQGAESPGDSARRDDMQRRGIEGGVALLASRLWDVVPVRPPEVPRPGLAWTDTISRDASDGPFRQAMRGTRVSRIAGERVVGGHRLWIIHDSAAVTYEERYPERDRTLDTTVLVVRTVAGTIRGTHLYDPGLRLSRERDDTTSLSGEAVLRYPDGRTYRTPARYERMRRWDLLDAPRYAARITELRAENARRSGGMVMVPGAGLERRLAEGDAKARDSLLAAWQRTTDPSEAAGLFDLLTTWAARDVSSTKRIDSVRVSAGDTAYLYELLARRAYGEEPVDTAAVLAMLPFMDDPSLAWSLGLSRDWLYENLVQSLTTWPRAAAAVKPPHGRVACTIDACGLLAGQWRTAREPRLRDVGLVALMSMDPAHWADTVLALDGPRRPLLHDAAMLARGAGATWPAASKAPIPPPGSDWHAWLEWMDGGNTLPRVRFEESHATAVRFQQARTGRDVVAEWRRQYEEARSIRRGSSSAPCSRASGRSRSRSPRSPVRSHPESRRVWSSRGRRCSGASAVRRLRSIPPRRRP